MRASLCRFGKLPSLVNRQLLMPIEIPGNPTRDQRKRLRHMEKCRGTFINGATMLWSKRNQRKCRAEQARRIQMAKEQVVEG